MNRMIRAISRLDNTLIEAFQYGYDLLWDAFGLRLGTAVRLGTVLITLIYTVWFSQTLVHYVGVVPFYLWLIGLGIVGGVELAVVLFISNMIVPYRRTNRLQGEGRYHVWNVKALLQIGDLGWRLITIVGLVVVTFATGSATIILICVVFALYMSCVRMRERRADRFAAKHHPMAPAT